GEVMLPLLRGAYLRFPGEFWVNFRLGTILVLARADETDLSPSDQLRHLSAAVAARPRSVAARIALGTRLLAKDRNDPTGLALVRGAAELDPRSPWPHLVLGEEALRAGNWPEARAAFLKCVSLDPDLAFIALFGVAEVFDLPGFGGTKKPPEA